MDKKGIRIMMAIISLVLVFGILLFGSVILHNKKVMLLKEKAIIEKQADDQRITREEENENQKIPIEDAEIANDESEDSQEENEEEKKEQELVEKEEEKTSVESKLSNEELIVILEGILSIPPTEIEKKYDPKYISEILKVLGSRMKDMNEEEKQKIMKLLKTIKPPQTNKDN